MPTNNSIELKQAGTGLYDLMISGDIKARSVTLKQVISIITNIYEEEEENNGNKN